MQKGEEKGRQLGVELLLDGKQVVVVVVVVVVLENSNKIKSGVKMRDLMDRLHSGSRWASHGRFHIVCVCFILRDRFELDQKEGQKGVLQAKREGKSDFLSLFLARFPDRQS